VTTAERIALIERELNFIARQAQSIECANGRDFETVDEIGMAVDSAKRALFELQLGAQDATEEIPAGVGYPRAA
jgi:hypothetical protein